MSGTSKFFDPLVWYLAGAVTWGYGIGVGRGYGFSRPFGSGHTGNYGYRQGGGGIGYRHSDGAVLGYGRPKHVLHF